MNVYRSIMSDDVWIGYTISDNEDRCLDMLYNDMIYDTR